MRVRARGQNDDEVVDVIRAHMAADIRTSSARSAETISSAGSKVLEGHPWRAAPRPRPRPSTQRATRRPRASSGNRASAWHRWGAQLEEWLGPATELMLDLSGAAAGSAGARRGRGRGRPDGDRRAPGGAVRAGARHRHLGRDPRARAAAGGRGRPGQRGHAGHGRGGHRGRARPLRRGHQPARADLLPRPPAGAGRHAARAASRRPGRGHGLLDGRAQRVLLGAGLDHPPRGGSRRPPLPGQPGPFSLGRRGRAGARARPRRDSATSRSARSRRRCGSRPPPTASASSASPSARCTRCSPA